MRAGPGPARLPSLTEISFAYPRWRRWLHSLPPVDIALPDLMAALRRRRGGKTGGAGLPAALRHVASRLIALTQFVLWLARRIASWVVNLVVTLVQDGIDRLRAQPRSMLRVEQATDAQPDARSVAVMVQFSPTGAVSDMVLRQIEAYRACGFAVVLVSNSPTFPEEAWQTARRAAALVVHRRNYGLDFGGWKDVVPVALARWPHAGELLIVNDSILGPIRPLAPTFDALRAAGPGFFGLLESIQGGPHMQSWFTLARGRAAVADASAFLAALRLSRWKWNIIQRGELRMAAHMRAKGHRVAAVFGYRALVDLGLTDPAERSYLSRAIPSWMKTGDTDRARRLLMRHPVNPAHHLWRVLSGPAGCPFIKTELVRRNPGGLPDVEEWPRLVSPDSPCPPEMIRAHLAALGP